METIAKTPTIVEETDEDQSGHRAKIGGRCSPLLFTKKRVGPPEARQRAQSAASQHSLRSLLKGSSDIGIGPSLVPSSSDNHIPAVSRSIQTIRDYNQHIQSPVIYSSLRREPGASPGIGHAEPFTDDRRASALDLIAAGTTVIGNTVVGSAGTNNTEKTVQPLNDNNEGPDEPVVESDEELDQKRLTTQALRKLSVLRAGTVAPTNDDSDNVNREISARHLSNSNSSCSSSTTSANGLKVANNSALKIGSKNLVLDFGMTTTGIHALERAHSTLLKSNPSLRRNSTNLSVNHHMSNGSLNAPKSRKHIRQLENPKKPLYVPAVLRDIAETNLTNEDLQFDPSDPSNLDSLILSSGYTRNYYVPNTGHRAASIRSQSSSILETCKNKISSYFFGNYSSSGAYPPVHMQNNKSISITKAHWVPDALRTSCQHCHKLFSFWERKHHCRHCGEIFCQRHLRHWLYLDKEANFIVGGGGDGQGILCKICDNCLGEYEAAAQNSKKSSNQKGDTQVVKAVQSSKPHIEAKRSELGPINAPKASPNEDDKTDKEVLGSMVGSVPADWNWSSF